MHDPERIAPAARAAISDSRHAVYFSAASAWELEIKAAKGKVNLSADWLATVEETGFLQLPITASDARKSARLPWHHSDPFDRLLVAQAIGHGLRIVTRDPLLGAYDVVVLAV